MVNAILVIKVGIQAVSKHFMTEPLFNEIKILFIKCKKVFTVMTFFSLKQFIMQSNLSFNQ